ncbi:MAG: hypothetical protein ABW166_05710 [Sedimenticola sp.]
MKKITTFAVIITTATVLSSLVMAETQTDEHVLSPPMVKQTAADKVALNALAEYEICIAEGRISCRGEATNLLGIDIFALSRSFQFAITSAQQHSVKGGLNKAASDTEYQ